ncbi:hypothetical protein [Robiginitalea sp. SC105]|uniref:hypothetical protein n=1 Tax=Robiginitalea sp. SC105 TaxID=2762332 RepID=UPI00163A536B|nr:hypothetical protein [Robiginitalea sp. SC105]MBC2838827.1 hypothetical protein [Robiginitalea sp. SC105]
MYNKPNDSHRRGNLARIRILAPAFYFCLALILASCSSMGPRTIRPDGFNYNQRIADQENEQLLLNIVRLRYLEMPRFLNVASVISQYSRSGSAGIGGDFNSTRSLVGNTGASWSDRPTITYTPMSGQAFAQSLLTPLPPAVIFFLIQSGWSAERLMRLTNSMINGIHNEIGTPGERRQGDPEFKELLGVLHELQRAGALGMHFNGDWPKVDVDIVLPANPRTDSIRRSIAHFKQILDLDPDQHIFDINYGVVREERNQILVQTHSILEMLSNISWYIDVPAEHVAEGRTHSTFIPDDPDLIHIRVAPNKPDGAYLSIKYRDHWYYIEDTDVKSKNTFSVIQILMSMANDGSGSVGPLISIGN